MSIDDFSEPKSASLAPVSVFFPFYNEAENITRTLTKAFEVLTRHNIDFEMIIINDGSLDETGRIADFFAASDARVRVVHHEKNLGYGSALRSGFNAAKKELVFYTDGDGQFDMIEMPALLDLIGQYDIVSCYRINRREGFVRRVFGWCWTKLICHVFDLKLKDIDCGFKLFRREIFDDIAILSSGALVDAEILARATRKGYTVTQVGVQHYPRIAGNPTGARISVIIRAFRELLKLRRNIVNENRH